MLLAALMMSGTASADTANLNKLKANPLTAQLLGACQPQVDTWIPLAGAGGYNAQSDLALLLSDYQKPKAANDIKNDIEMAKMSIDSQRGSAYPKQSAAIIGAMNIRMCMSKAMLDKVQGRPVKAASTTTQPQSNSPPGKNATDIHSVNNCVRLIKAGQPGAGNYGALENACAFAIDVRYCNEGTKSNSWSGTMSCTEGGKNWGGSTGIGANKRSAAHIGGRHTYWFACRKPAGVSDASFVKDQGIKARCR